MDQVRVLVGATALGRAEAMDVPPSSLFGPDGIGQDVYERFGFGQGLVVDPFQRFAALGQPLGERVPGGNASTD